MNAKSRMEGIYERYVTFKLAKLLKTTRKERQPYETVVDNFAKHTWPDDSIIKLMFPLKCATKLAKQDSTIKSIEIPRWKLQLECYLDTSSLKSIANKVVTLIKFAINGHLVEVLSLITSGINVPRNCNVHFIIS